MAITNEMIKSYAFLKEMYADDFYPKFLVDKGKQILVHLCEMIESQNPKDENELYLLTHLAAEEFNRLDEGLQKNDSEIETVARDCIGEDFYFIAGAYGFHADINEEKMCVYGRSNDVDWIVDFAKARAVFDKHLNHLAIRGNADPLVVFYQGTPEEVYQATCKCLEVGRVRDTTEYARGEYPGAEQSAVGSPD